MEVCIQKFYLHNESTEDAAVLQSQVAGMDLEWQGPDQEGGEDQRDDQWPGISGPETGLLPSPLLHQG